MKHSLRIALILGWLAASLGACSKHECKLETDDEKKTIGKIAEMTQGAARCRVQGASNISGMVMQNLTCTIGGDTCIPLMEAIHGDGSTIDSVSTSYVSWLKEHKWELSKEEDVESKAMNGNTLKGKKLKANKGNVELIVSLFPFGKKLVQTRTLYIKTSG